MPTFRRVRHTCHAGHVDHLYESVVPAATRLAYLLTGDDGRAAAIGGRTFVRLRARLGEFADAYGRETWSRRSVVRQAPRRIALRSEASDDDVWAAFLSLPRRDRAAVALHLYEGMSIERIADILGCSPAAAASWLERGLAAVEQGSDVDRSEVAHVLREKADAVDVRPETAPRMIRRAAVLRAIVVTVLLVAVPAAVGGGIRLARHLEADAEVEVDERDSRRVNPQQVADVAPRGAPPWCPDPRSFSGGKEVDPAEASAVAQRFVIALVHGGRRTIAAHVLPSPGAPDPRQWPHPDSARVRAVQSGPAGSDADLERTCGKPIAERTVKVVFRIADDVRQVLAVYLAPGRGGPKVWATLQGPPREGLDSF
jgi:hypothetical protein